MINKTIRVVTDSAKEDDVIYVSNDLFVRDAYLKDINSSAVEIKQCCADDPEEMQSAAFQDNTFALACGEKMPNVGVFVSIRIDGSVLNGIVTEHCEKDGRPVFHFEYNHHSANGDLVKGLKWAWPDQIVNSGSAI